MAHEAMVGEGYGGLDWEESIDQHLVRQTVERGLSRNSLEAYGGDLRDFLQFCRMRLIAPNQLDGRVLTAYLEHLAVREFAVASQRRRLAAVRGLVRSLLDWGVLERDPARNLKLRPHPRSLPRTLGAKEIELLLNAIDVTSLRGLRDRAMFEIAYGCGLRVSELVGLRLNQIDLAAKIVIVIGKGGKERIVPLGTAALRALTKYLAARQQAARMPLTGASRTRSRPAPVVRPISAVFITRLGRRCLGTAISPPPSSIHICPGPTCARCIAPTIHGAEPAADFKRAVRRAATPARIRAARPSNGRGSDSGQ
jgi:site-specific recombinase XerC